MANQCILAARSPSGRVWAGTSGLAQVAGAVFVDGAPAGNENVPMSLDLHFHIAILENGKLQQTGEPIGIPSRAILFRVMKALDSTEPP